MPITRLRTQVEEALLGQAERSTKAADVEKGTGK